MGSSLEVFRIKEKHMVVLLSIRQHHPVSYGHEGSNKVRSDEILHPLEEKRHVKLHFLKERALDLQVLNQLLWTMGI